MQQASRVQHLAARVEAHRDRAKTGIGIIRVVNDFCHADFDTFRGQQVHPALKDIEVHQQEIVDPQAEIILHSLHRQRRAAAGITVAVAARVGCVDARRRAAVGNIDPQVTRDAQNANRFAHRVNVDDHHCIGAEVFFVIGYTGALVNAQQQNTHLAGVIPPVIRQRVQGRGWAGWFRRGGLGCHIHTGVSCGLGGCGGQYGCGDGRRLALEKVRERRYLNPRRPGIERHLPRSHKRHSRTQRGRPNRRDHTQNEQPAWNTHTSPCAELLNLAKTPAVSAAFFVLSA